MRRTLGALSRLTYQCAFLVVLVASANANPVVLYGKITTRRGEVIEGLIRWDRNEASVLDVLDADKELPDANREAAARAGTLGPQQREVRILGVTIVEADRGFPTRTESGIRFGHIKSIEKEDDGAWVTLHSGRKVRFLESADLGNSMREIVLVGADGQEKQLRWRDLTRVDFQPAPEGVGDSLQSRLQGTLLTREGIGFSGLICWDMDEIFGSDTLDGEADGKDREIPFAEIRSIERKNSRSAWVTLKNGEVLELSGSNDVDKDNRGILVLDPGLGQARANWDDFLKVVFEDVPSLGKIPEMDGGNRLYGTISRRDGPDVTGWIRWDNDEEYTWELVDGRFRDLDLDVEFSLVERIDKKSDDSSVVTMRDGRSFELSRSNDVNYKNKGIFLQTSEGKEVVVGWDTFLSLRLAAPPS